MLPNTGAPMEANAHYRALLNISFGVPSKEALPPSRSPSWNPSQRDAPFPEPSFIHISQFQVNVPPSRFQVPLGHKGAPMERDAHIRRLS
jgi:hypothetical protein